MASDTPAFCSPRTLLHGLGLTLVVNTAIGLLLWQSGRVALDEQLVYAQAIGLSIWALTNVGARWLSRPDDPGGFPRGWRLAVLVPASTLLGSLLGLWLGDQYAVHDSAWALTSQNPALLGKIVALSMTAGAAMTVYFYLRGRSNYLQAELERAKAQQAQAQLRLLESQLEPHMLFNTLANLRALMLVDPAKAQDMLDHLVAFLRSTLVATRHADEGPHTLADEFARINDYLALMAIRMGPRLQVSLNLPTALRALRIPPLLLQPLVENAIRHGLEPHPQGGLLHVGAFVLEEPARPGKRAVYPGQDWLVLDVQDNGAGLPAHPIPGSEGCGFGLTQVRERLLNTYGPQASLTLTRPPQGGTLARVKVPVQGPHTTPATT